MKQINITLSGFLSCIPSFSSTNIQKNKLSTLCCLHYIRSHCHLLDNSWYKQLNVSVIVSSKGYIKYYYTRCFQSRLANKFLLLLLFILIVIWKIPNSKLCKPLKNRWNPNGNWLTLRKHYSNINRKVFPDCWNEYVKKKTVDWTNGNLFLTWFLRPINQRRNPRREAGKTVLEASPGVQADGLEVGFDAAHERRRTRRRLADLGVHIVRLNTHT